MTQDCPKSQRRLEHLLMCRIGEGIPWKPELNHAHTHAHAHPYRKGMCCACACMLCTPAQFEHCADLCSLCRSHPHQPGSKNLERMRAAGLPDSVPDGLVVAMSAHRVGRVARQVRRCFIAAGGAVQFSDLVAWSYAGNRRPHRWPIYRVLRRYGEPTGKRGWWAPNDALMKLIKE